VLPQQLEEANGGRRKRRDGVQVKNEGWRLDIFENIDFGDIGV